MCKLLCGHVFSMILGTGLKVELLGKSGFKVWNCQTAFPKGWTIWHSLQNRRKVLILSSLVDASFEFYFTHSCREEIKSSHGFEDFCNYMFAHVSVCKCVHIRVCTCECSAYRGQRGVRSPEIGITVGCELPECPL